MFDLDSSNIPSWVFLFTEVTTNDTHKEVKEGGIQ